MPTIDGRWFLAVLASGVVGVVIHAWTTGTLWAKENAAPVTPPRCVLVVDSNAEAAIARAVGSGIAMTQPADE